MESFSKIIWGLVTASTVPLVILNVLGGLVGGIWLLFMGEWRLVVTGILVLIIAPFVYSIILIPTLPLVYGMTRLLEKGWKVLAGILCWLNIFIVHAVSLGWTIFIFLVMLSAGGETTTLPYLLFGYAIATGPFAYMAQKEAKDATGSHLAVWLLQFAFGLLFLFYYIGILSFALPIILIVALLIEIWQIKVAFLCYQLENKYA